MAPTLSTRVAGGAAALLLLAGGAAGSAVASVPTSRATAAHPAATKVRLVSPLDGRGRLRPGYTVAATGKGRCWTTSFENGALYRCFRGDLIQDPCWAQSGRSAVVCLAAPWDRRVTRLHLTRALPAAGSYGPRLWGLRVTGGVDVSCLASQGASGTVGRRGISYFCDRGWVLLGARPDRSAPLWTMPTARRVAGHYQLRGRMPLSLAWKASSG